MSEHDLQFHINKEINKHKNINYDEKVQESNALIEQLNLMENSDAQIELNGFTREEVFAAAKYALQAKPYDLSVRHLDAKGSPIYYKKNNKSRGRLKRKSLDDSGQALIKVAEQKLKERRAKEEEDKKREKDQKIQDCVSGAALDGQDLLNIPKEWKRNKDYEAKSEGFSGTKIFRKIQKNNQSFFKAVDQTIKGDYTFAKKEKMPKADEENAYMDRVKEILSKDGLSYEKINEKFTKEMKSELAQELKKPNLSEQEISEAREKVLSKYNQKIKLYNSWYKEVKEGNVSPEALKLFFSPELFRCRTMAINNLYSKIESNNKDGNVIPEPTPEEQKMYNSAVRTMLERYQVPCISIQGNGGTTPLGKYSERFNSEYKTYLDGMVKNDPKFDYVKYMGNIGLSRTESFIHVTGKNQYKYVSDAHPVKDRFYITCKPQQHTKMVEAWGRALEKHPDIADTLHFKLLGKIDRERQDNIVIYYNNEAQGEMIKTLMNTFKTECEKENVLADSNEMLCTTEEYAPGLSHGKEFKTKNIFKDLRDNSFVDMNGYKKLSSAVATKNHDESTTHNLFLAQSIYLSELIVREKHNIKPEDAISDNEELMNEVKDYVNDFIRLAGVNPETFENV